METTHITSQSSLTETKQTLLTQTGLNFPDHLNSPFLIFSGFAFVSGMCHQTVLIISYKGLYYLHQD